MIQFHSSVYKYLLFFFIFWGLSPQITQAQSLSPQAKISLITCSPGDELYSMYGHSAIRVADPQYGIDYVFNYGTFNFKTPNFYTKFVRGKLKYQLSISDFADFVAAYQYYNRSVFEQDLNLTLHQKNAVFKYLQINYLPENREYLYDFFFDNCATKIRDVFKIALQDSLKIDPKTALRGQSFRQIVGIYQKPFPWADFGVDLAMGTPSDRKATAPEYMFIPDYLADGFAKATVKTASGWQPFAQPVRTVFQAPQPANPSVPLITPTIICWLLFVIAALFTFFQWQQKKFTYKLDVVLFGVIGLLGVILLFLTTGTDHKAFAKNLNLLWAIPLHLPVAFLLLPKKRPAFVKFYFLATAVLMAILLVSWQWLPQQYHPAFLPLILLLALRAGFIYFTCKKKQVRIRY